MVKRNTTLWTLSSFAGCIFIIYLLMEIVYPESIFNLAVKKGNTTFWGWLIILFLIAIVWLMIWQMLQEIGCRMFISIFTAFIISISIGLMKVAVFSNWDWYEWLGAFGLIMRGLLPIGYLLLLVFMAIGKIAVKFIRK